MTKSNQTKTAQGVGFRALKMKGMDWAYVESLHQTLKPCDALKEFIDNSIDAGAKTINVSLSKNRTLTITDDGNGMIGALRGYCENFTIKKVRRPNGQIGMKGQGGKMSMIRFSDIHGGGSTVTVETTNGISSEKMIWNISKEAKEKLNELDFYNEEGNAFETDIPEHGTKITITHSSITPETFGNTKKQIGYSHSFKIKYRGVNIFFKNEDSKNPEPELIEPRDYFYLTGLIGENAEYSERMKCNGEYISEDGKFIYIVRTAQFKGKINDKQYQIEIPCIAVFVKGHNYKNQKWDYKLDAYKGQKFGVIYNERYISCEDTSIAQHLKTLNRGGASLLRFLMIVENEEFYDILTSSSSNKSSGLRSIMSNSDLKKLTTTVDKDFFTTLVGKKTTKGNKKELDVYEYIQSVYNWLTYLNIERMNVSRNDENPNKSSSTGTWPINRERVTQITKIGVSQNLSNDYGDELLESMVPGLDNYPQNIKDMFYAAYNSLTKDRVNTNKIKSCMLALANIQK